MRSSTDSPTGKSPTGESPDSAPPVALVTGGSAGLGLEIAVALRQAGYRVAIVGRDATKLSTAAAAIKARAAGKQAVAGDQVLTCRADLAEAVEAERAIAEVIAQWQQLDLIVNNIGSSDRGFVADLEVARLSEVIAANVVPMLCTSRAALPHLEQSRGVIINIGSLAAKVGARYLGAYPAAKHALAGLTQQMRLEWRARGVHVGLINPGPIRRDDAGQRYAQRIEAASQPAVGVTNDAVNGATEGAAQERQRLPPQANLPGGGTKVKGLDPARVAAAVVRMARRRSPDMMLPGHLRPLVAIGHLWPALGDWLLLKFTSIKK
ncbi:SDR family NAD(P)-dependent oxidoreductase [Planctomycetaceae bacterium SH139]